jgi:hypothetical protein
MGIITLILNCLEKENKGTSDGSSNRNTDGRSAVGLLNAVLRVLRLRTRSRVSRSRLATVLLAANAGISTISSRNIGSGARVGSGLGCSRSGVGIIRNCQSVGVTRDDGLHSGSGMVCRDNGGQRDCGSDTVPVEPAIAVGQGLGDDLGDVGSRVRVGGLRTNNSSDLVSLITAVCRLGVVVALSGREVGHGFRFGCHDQRL